jgi:hypothetical protein
VVEKVLIRGVGAAGLHALEGVAFLLKKRVSDLETIEILEGVGCFHKSRDGAGFYLVDVRDMSCSCPGYRFTRSCRHIRHVEERVAEEATPRRPATTAHKMTEAELAERKARIAERNRRNAEARAAKKADRPREAFRSNNPDEAEAMA